MKLKRPDSQVKSHDPLTNYAKGLDDFLPRLSGIKFVVSRGKIIPVLWEKPNKLITCGESEAEGWRSAIICFDLDQRQKLFGIDIPEMNMARFGVLGVMPFLKSGVR